MKNTKIIIYTTLIVFLVCILVFSMVKLNENRKSLEYIYVASLPYKINYYEGEELNIDGLQIVGVRKNKDFEFINNNDLVIQGFDSSNITTEQIIRVFYEDLVCNFVVSIEEAPSETPFLVSIELEKLPKTEYIVGEWLETDLGVILKKYSDGSVKRVQLSNSYIYGYSEEISNTPGIYTLTVKYVENGILAETTFDITVTE